jgi:uncharacterized membrane protein YjjP (DUF1212 family)
VSSEAIGETITPSPGQTSAEPYEPSVRPSAETPSEEVHTPEAKPTTETVPAPPPATPGEESVNPTTLVTPTAPTVEPSPEATATAAVSPSVLPRVPPAASASNQAPISWLIAVIVLIVSVVALLWAHFRGREVEADAPVRQAPAPAPAAERLAALERLGEALIDAGYSVSTVRDVLLDAATAGGASDTEVVVFPTALFVSTRGTEGVHTGAVSSGHEGLNFSQIDALSEVVAGARSGALSSPEIIAGLRRMRSQPPPYRNGQRVFAYALLSAALSVLLDASWGGVGLAAALGGAVGAALVATEHVARRYRALVTVATAFAVSIVVLTVTSIGLDPGVLPSLVAPLVTFLPGALLTTGFIELATGQMMAGAGRLAAGAMQLMLLAAGIVGGGALVGVPQLDLTASHDPLGPIAPWVAVAAFGLALTVYLGGRLRTMGWNLLVLYTAYGAQIIGDLFLGGVLSAVVGAAAMTPVAILASRHASGPAAFVSFLPAFYLLVPGVIGLVGVTSLLGGDATGFATLLTTASTMVAIALGVLVGSALSSRLQHEHGLLI